MTFRILVSDKLSEKGLAVFRAADGVEVDFVPGLGKNVPAFLEKIGDYDGLAVRSGTKVTAEVLAQADRLKVVGRAGIGVDNIDLAAASAHGVVVMNTPDGNVVTTAEHAIALMCALTRKIPQATASMRAGKWEKSKFSGRELFRKTLGIVGLGNIGKIVADRALGLRMKVIAFDPFVTEEKARELGVTLVDIDTLVSTCDVLTIHVPLLDATRNIINASRVAQMKQGALLINGARGGLVDEAAVAEAVKSGQLGGAAFDVFTTEPPPADHPLLSVDNIILTPHLGASTAEAQENVAVAVAEQMIAYLKNDVVQNALNAPSVPASVLEAIGPYIKLGRVLGQAAGQLHTGPVREIRLVYGGEIASREVAPVKVGALASFLGTRLGPDVNEINAPVVAKDRGLEIIEEKRESARDFVSTVEVHVTGDGGTTSVTGAAFGAGEPRIVAVDGMRLEIVPQGNLLLTQHKDQPGVIGQIGTILGGGKLNISRMTLGLESTSGSGARAAIAIDSAATETVVDQIRAIDGIAHVTQLKF